MSGPSDVPQVGHAKHVRRGGPSDEAANDNAPAAPIVVLHPTGDGLLLYRALARVLVRNALRELTAAPAPSDLDS